MRGSLPLFRVFGIPVRMHVSMLLFLPLVGFLLSAGTGWGAFLLGLLLITLVFGFVLLHELGHSVVALYHGVPVRQIVLFPLGGIAGLSHIPCNPRQELQITAAGPLVNFLLAAIFGLIFFFVPSPFLGMLIQINLMLGIFNLLPGFPMDGGRILRALLACRMRYVRATRIAVRVGQITAVGLGVIGLLTIHPILMLIAVSIFFAAREELRAVELQAAREQPPVAFQPPRFWVRFYRPSTGRYVHFKRE